MNGGGGCLVAEPVRLIATIILTPPPPPVLPLLHNLVLTYSYHSIFQISRHLSSDRLFNVIFAYLKVIYKTRV